MFPGDRIKTSFEREFDLTAKVTDRYFDWLAKNARQHAEHSERMRLAVAALRAELGAGGLSFIGFGAGGNVFEHESHPATVFKVKMPENDRHYVNLDLDTLPTQEFSQLLNLEKLLVAETHSRLVPVEAGARLILRQAKGIPLDHVVKYVDAKGSRRYDDELALLAKCYVDFQPLLFSIGRINTDANLSNHLIDDDGNFLLHDLDIVYPIGGIDWHDTALTSRRSMQNLVEFLFWFLANNLTAYRAFAEPFRAALAQNDHLIELHELARNASWPHLEKALTRYGGARFLGPDRFLAEARTVEAMLQKRFPGAIDRVVASLRGLHGIAALSETTGIKLSPDEQERIVALTRTKDFDKLVHDRPKAKATR